ncbi:MAG: hypothetical protein U0M06_10285 [Clostridia bacterium]|nr:hypothetical protein [Clostridia bacterium]
MENKYASASLPDIPEVIIDNYDYYDINFVDTEKTNSFTDLGLIGIKYEVLDVKFWCR